MLILRTGSLYLFLALALVALAAAGIYGYGSIVSAGPLSEEGMKFLAERLLYITALLSALLCAAVVLLVRRGRRILRELDKINEIARYGHNNTALYFARLGRLGESLSLLFHRISSLSEMKSKKISALSSLSGFLIDNIGLGLMLMDAEGRVIRCSRKLLVAHGLEMRDVAGKRSSDLIEGVKFGEIAGEMERLRTEIVLEAKGVEGVIDYSGKCIFYPIFNSAGGLANALCIIDRNADADELSRKAIQVKAEETGVSSLMRGFIKERLKRG